MSNMINLISTIKSGQFELIDSGIVQILEKELTTLLFETISIKFEFSTDEKDATSKIAVDASEQNAVKFNLVNVNMPSYGTTDFEKFATLVTGEEVYISFRVHSLNDKRVRSLEYSIYKKNV